MVIYIYLYSYLYASKYSLEESNQVYVLTEGFLKKFSKDHLDNGQAFTENRF